MSTHWYKRGMIHIKDHRQRELFDAWCFLSPKRRKLLEESWAGLFQRELLSELPVDKVAPFFSEDFGRPTKELHTMLGGLILQQAFDLTDEETVTQLSFNIQWHYALNITEETDSAKYISPKTLWNMRKIVTENGLDTVIFEGITGKLARVFNVDTTHQRLDSVHIQSNMRRLGRIGIFSSTIHRFLVNLRRKDGELYEAIDQGIRDRYLSDKSLQSFSMVKPSESAKTLKEVSGDLFRLVEQFKGMAEVRRMHSYRLLERVLKDQCKISEDGKAVSVKKPQEIPSDSLQNPSDPEASYDGHKGQGYQVQLMETYHRKEETKEERKEVAGEEREKEQEEETLNLITHIEVEPAHISDAHALIPAIEESKKRNLAPRELLADTLYGGDENCQEAKELGVKVLSPARGSGRKEGEERITLTDFEVSERGKILFCPQGHAPVREKTKKTRHTVAFDSRQCGVCPFQANCPAKRGKKNHYLHYTDKEMRLARRRAYEQTEAFRERYRYRSGIEATMSEYDRRTGVKHLRVRGLKAVRFSATLKALAINIFRAARVHKARVQETAPTCAFSASVHAIYRAIIRFFTFRKRSNPLFPFSDFKPCDYVRLT